MSSTAQVEFRSRTREPAEFLRKLAGLELHVGIVGPHANEIEEGTDKTLLWLGMLHEFGSDVGRSQAVVGQCHHAMEPQIGNLANQPAAGVGPSGSPSLRQIHVLGGQHDLRGFLAHLLQERIRPTLQQTRHIAGSRIAAIARQPALDGASQAIEHRTGRIGSLCFARFHGG